MLLDLGLFRCGKERQGNKNFVLNQLQLYKWVNIFLQQNTFFFSSFKIDRNTILSLRPDIRLGLSFFFCWRVMRGGRLTETVIFKSEGKKVSAILFCTSCFGYLQKGALASLQREGERPWKKKQLTSLYRNMWLTLVNISLQLSQSCKLCLWGAEEERASLPCNQSSRRPLLSRLGS